MGRRWGGDPGLTLPWVLSLSLGIPRGKTAVSKKPHSHVCAWEAWGLGEQAESCGCPGRVTSVSSQEAPWPEEVLPPLGF